MTAGEPALAETSAGRFCFACGYNLHGIASDRCPECGTIILTEQHFPIPWSHRHGAGVIRSFFQTVRLVMFKPSVLATAMAGHVDERAARWFRWIVVLVVSISTVAVFTAALVENEGTRFLSQVDGGLNSVARGVPTDAHLWEISVIWSAGATLLPVIPLGLVLTIILGLNIPRAWFRRKNLPIVRQNRAFALSSYSGAPLVWLFIPAAIAVGFADFKQGSSVPDHFEFILAGEAILLLIVISYCMSVLRLMERTTHCSWRRVIAAAIMLPLSWTYALAMGIGLFPALIGLLWLMIDSLRK